MPPIPALDETDPAAIEQLMKDFQGPDVEASKRAFEALVRLGSPIGELLGTSQCDPRSGDSCGYYDIAAAIQEAGLSDAKVFEGLAQAVVGKDSSIRLAAIWVCTQINPAHQVVLDALVQALGDHKESVRREAARALGELRVAAPSVLKGLAAALRDSDHAAVSEVIRALGEIGSPSPEVLAGLVHFLGDVNSPHCGQALLALRYIGSFDQAMHQALRQVATSAFSFPTEQPSGYGDDYAYWLESYEGAKRRHEQHRQQAVELLTQIAVEPIIQEAMASSTRQPILSAEDQRILAWFKDVDLTDYLTPLQVFWCIGQADRDGIESEGRAIGYGKLEKRLKQFQPTYALVRLYISNSYIRQGCLDVVYALLDKEPFYSHAWTDDERGMEFRVPYMRGGREEGQWTRKARKAFHYVNRFLSIRKCLPQITVTKGKTETG